MTLTVVLLPRPPDLRVSIPVENGVIEKKTNFEWYRSAIAERTQRVIYLWPIRLVRNHFVFRIIFFFLHYYLCFRTSSPSAFLANTNGSRLETTMSGALISLFRLPMLDKSETRTKRDAVLCKYGHGNTNKSKFDFFVFISFYTSGNIVSRKTRRRVFYIDAGIGQQRTQIVCRDGSF